MKLHCSTRTAICTPDLRRKRRPPVDQCNPAVAIAAQPITDNRAADEAERQEGQVQ